MTIDTNNPDPRLDPVLKREIAAKLWETMQSYHHGRNSRSSVSEPDFEGLPERERVEWLMMVAIVVKAYEEGRH